MTEPSFAILRIGSTRTAANRPRGRWGHQPVGSRPAQLLTYAVRPTTTTSYGALPTGISRFTLPVVRSISASEFFMLSTTNIVLPSALIDMPTGTTPSSRRDLPAARVGVSAAVSLPSLETLNTPIAAPIVEA